jgi:preprotein translocase subunit Sec63
MGPSSTSTRDAEDCVIRAAYRALCARHHPDRLPPGERQAAHERMSRINAAYEVLGDPARRAAYDAELARRGRPAGAASAPPSPPPKRPWSVDRIVRLLARLVARAVVVLASVVLAVMLAVQEKPWWVWALEWVGSGFAATPHFAVDWGLLLFVVSLGVGAARRVGRP